MDSEQQSFKKHSPTYYLSARLLPKKLRLDIYRLYYFVHSSDEYAEGKESASNKLTEISKNYQKALDDQAYDATVHAWDEPDTKVVKHLVRLQHRYKFDESWIDNFFAARAQDVKKGFQTLDETLAYVQGRAEVAGLMLARIVKLPEEAFDNVRAQARAMQWVHFLRDIAIDAEKGISRFPATDLKKAGLTDLKEETVRQNPEAFKKFIHIQTDRYRGWQAEAKKGYTLVPKRLRVPLQSTAEVYDWMVRKIEKNPLIVYKQKLTPRKRRILRHALKNSGQALPKPKREHLAQIKKLRPRRRKKKH